MLWKVQCLKTQHIVASLKLLLFWEIAGTLLYR